MAPVKDYTPQQMGEAMEAVRGGLSVGTAAKRFGVPITTLRNKVTGKSPAVCSMGPPTILTADEENLLKQWIFASAERHFPITKDKLLDSVQKIINVTERSNPFTNNRPGKKWYGAFLRRHPDIAERVAQNLTTSRDNVTETQIRSWFDEISNYLQSKGLLEVFKDPTRVYNSDESAFFFNPKPGRVLAKKGDKNVYSSSGSEKDNLTVLLTANAAGDLPPPMIVFAYERIPKNISLSVPNSYGIGRSESGWMCAETFYEYVTNVFYPWLVKNNITLPVIFFLDGHRSHLTSHLSEFCSNVGIEVIALYPNSTHILQPMDIAVFRPLKLFWKQEAQNWKDNFGPIQKDTFAPIFQTALALITKDCIKNGFKAGGLCPFGPEFIDFSKLRVNNRTGLEPTQRVSSEQNVLFLKMLEDEITKLFTNKKLALFKKRFYMDRSALENEVFDEDMSLYIIWAKYKSLCVSHTSTANTVNVTDNHSVSCEENIDVPLPSTSGPSQPFNHNKQITLIKEPNTSRNTVNVTDNHTVSCEKNIDVTLPSTSGSSQPFNHNKQKTPIKVPNTRDTGLLDDNIVIPSPFKKALFWPEPPKKNAKIHKEKVPSAITSEAWKEYNMKKELKKKALEEEKEKRKEERLQKKKQKEELQKKKSETKEKKAKKTGKDSKNKNSKKRKISVSSDDDTDSDITYAETDDDETFVDSDEFDFWTKQCKNEVLQDEAREMLPDIDQSLKQQVEKYQEKKTNKLVDCFEHKPDLDKENIDFNITIQDIKPTNRIKEVNKDQDINIPKENMEEQNKTNDQGKTKKPKLNILNDTSVSIILDEKTGALKLGPKIDDTSDVTSIETDKRFVLAKFESQNGKKTYQYVCTVEETSEDKMVVIGLKSKKNKKTFKLVDQDISIIDEKDIICYLPQPIFKDDCYIFPDNVEVKEM